MSAMSGINTRGDAMKKTNFGGIGTEILMFKTQFEIEADRVDALMEQISAQNAAVANAYGSLSKIFEGNLEKLAGAADLNKRLVASKSLLGNANEEIKKLQGLMAECEQAQERALQAMPDFAMFFSNGRQDTVPNRAYFTAGKDASAVAFVMPGQKQPSIAAANIGDAALARRFSQQQ
jgi:hypothetical protein